MAKATSHPNRNFISSEDVQGTQLKGQKPTSTLCEQIVDFGPAADVQT
jgi:hypothetical protein